MDTNNAAGCPTEGRSVVSEINRLSDAIESGEFEICVNLAACPVEDRATLEAVQRLVRSFVTPLEQLGALYARMALNDYSSMLTGRYQGKWGEMAKSADLIKDRLDRVIKAMTLAGNGDFSIFRALKSMGRRSKDDRLIPAGIALSEAVDRLLGDLDAVVNAFQQGQLSKRIDPSAHGGEYLRVVNGVNEMLQLLARPMDEARQVLQAMAQRDLTRRMEATYQGDLALLAEAVNATAQATQEALQEVAETSTQIGTAVTEISSSSQAVAQGASHQADALRETVHNLESMTSTTKRTAENASQASTLAQAARAAANKGGTSMTEMMGAMDKIRRSAEATSEIIRDINEIAFQTNLLALNAAVEAARAGDAGRGFAVVAEEVRSLALRSKDAARRTEELIKESVRQAGEGATISSDVRAELDEIVSGVGKVADIVTEIARASMVQSNGIAQINSAVTQVDRVTQDNAASAEQSSSATVALTEQVKTLSVLVNSFTLGLATSPGEPHQRANLDVVRAPEPPWKSHFVRTGTER